MDSPEDDIALPNGEDEQSVEPSAHPGDDLQHIAAVLADPNPSSGQLQGRRMIKHTKKRLKFAPDHGRRAMMHSEAGPSGRRIQFKAAAHPLGSIMVPEGTARSPDPKGKGKQQQQQHTSAAGPSMGRLEEPDSSDSDWEEQKGTAGRPRMDTQSGGDPSSSVEPSAADLARASSKRRSRGKLKPARSCAPGMHPFYDRPGLQQTAEAAFCEACSCWVPSAPHARAEMWKKHVKGERHTREVASRLRDDAARESANRYRSNVLPAMKHAAEELRCLGVSGAGGAGPSLRQATRSANQVLRAGDATSHQIDKLHADAMRELVHHAGGSADFQRLATRLGRERLACAWPVLAAKQPRPADNALLVLAATPATIACLAAQLPHTQATTIVISLASMHALDLAPTTASLCLLARALASGNHVRRLQVSLLGVRAASAASAAPAEHSAERDARLIGRFISELQRTVAVNCSLRLLSLRVMEPKLVAREWAEVQASAAHAAPRQRAAVTAALHPRVGGGCPLRWLPLHIFKEILDLAVPLMPCKVVLT